MTKKNYDSRNGLTLNQTHTDRKIVVPVPGKDGKTSTIEIGENGNFFIDGIDTGVNAGGGNVDYDQVIEALGYIPASQASLNNKVDKDGTKVLSTNDFTNALKTKLEGLSNYDDTEIQNALEGKVDKVEGYGLSEIDFTDARRIKLDSLENYNDTELRNELATKVDSVPGKGLSTNDFSNAYQNKLDSLEENKNQGYYLSLAELEANASTGPGYYAYVDDGSLEIQKYVWNETSSEWELSSAQEGTDSPQVVKQKYESNPNTNAYTDSAKAKLDSFTVSSGYLLISSTKVKAGQADYALDSDKWDGYQFADYLNQPVRSTDSPRFTGISSLAYVSGFAGSGYRIGPDNGDISATFDKLTVRKEMNVYELIINQIRASNGSIWVSDAIKILSVTPSGANFVCNIDTDSNRIGVPFVVNDILRCQRWTGRNVKYYVVRVTAVTTGSFTVTKLDGSGNPEAGDDVVRMGNTTNVNRQGAVYLTSSDSNAPYIDVIDEVTSASLVGKTKVRMGKLDGITDPFFGALSGYGLYGQNVYLTGALRVTGGNAATTNDINNITIGTTNILPDSNFKNGLTGGTNGFILSGTGTVTKFANYLRVVAGSNSNILIYKQIPEAEIGKDYTATCKVRTNSPTGNAQLRFQILTSNSSGGEQTTSSQVYGDWQIVSVTGKITSGQLRVLFRTLGTNTGDLFDLEWANVVVGTKAVLNWTPTIAENEQYINNSIDNATDILNDKIDAIDIGSVNLIRDSAIPRVKASFSGGGNDTSYFNNSIPLPAEYTTYTFSALVTLSNIVQNSGGTSLVAAGVRFNGTTNQYFDIVVSSLSNGTYYISGTTNLAVANATTATLRIRAEYINSGSITVREYKLEKGNKATDWSPSPDDPIEFEHLGETIIDGPTIRTDRINAVELAANSVFTDNLVAKKIRTATSGRRTTINYENDGSIRAYNTSGTRTFSVINGILTATSVNLSGSITATSGSFTGTITATSGKIASFTIDSIGLDAVGDSMITMRATSSGYSGHYIAMGSDVSPAGGSTQNMTARIQQHRANSAVAAHNTALYLACTGSTGLGAYDYALDADSGAVRSGTQLTRTTDVVAIGSSGVVPINARYVYKTADGGSVTLPGNPHDGHTVTISTFKNASSNTTIASGVSGRSIFLYGMTGSGTTQVTMNNQNNSLTFIYRSSGNSWVGV